MYAKLINGALRPAPYKLKVGDNIVWNPTAEMLLADGWKPVTYTPEPATEPGFYAESSWDEQTDSIVQVWTIVEEPADMDIPDDEALSILMGVDQ